MKAGLACPYSWDGPGGVQEHIRDPAEALMDLVHGVSAISPAGDDELPPGHVARPAGRFPSPATARGGHLEVARPVWVLSGAR
jgi:phosphatidyl-myo-inositol alpha-mannosyltransferase